MIILHYTCIYKEFITFFNHHLFQEIKCYSLDIEEGLTQYFFFKIISSTFRQNKYQQARDHSHSDPLGAYFVRL